MLILTEKLSVARDFAAALRAKKSGGCFRNQDVTITYCQGHLFELCPPSPSFYDKKFERWNVADLPIIPRKFCYEKIPAAAKQAETVRQRIPPPPTLLRQAQKNVFCLVPENFIAGCMDNCKHTMKKTPLPYSHFTAETPRENSVSTLPRQFHDAQLS